eukprot:758893-Hanusia_phi.AAC.1
MAGDPATRCVVDPGGDELSQTAPALALEHQNHVLLLLPRLSEGRHVPQAEVGSKRRYVCAAVSAILSTSCVALQALRAAPFACRVLWAAI